MSTTDPECLFCRIAAGEIPARIVAETELSIAFRDLTPQAPTHVLVIPRQHAATIGELAARDAESTADLFRLAARVAEDEQVLDGYRLVANTGPAAGQTVFHAHVHVLGGRQLTWPPG